MTLRTLLPARLPCAGLLRAGVLLAGVLLATPPGPLGAQRKPARPPAPGCADDSPHRSAHVRVDGARMHYLDWGGSGDPLVFLPGMGSSAHVFDDFAPRFTGRHRVIGVTRLGHGASEPSRRGYAPAVRVAQLVALLDSLRLDRVTLVGHARAGEELTHFAAHYPDRVRRLVYLDAAWDASHRPAAAERALADSILLITGPEPRLTDADRASVAAFREAQRRLGVGPSPAGELCARFPVDARGRLGLDPRSAVYRAMDSLGVDPAYRLVRAPALVIYARRGDSADDIPWIAGDSARIHRVAPLHTRALAAARATGEDRVRAELQGGRILHLRGGPWLFLRNPDEVEQAIVAFFDLR